MTTKSYLYSIINEVISLPPHEEIRYNRNDIPEPRDMGFEETIGEPAGQLADDRISLEDGRSVHARTYDNRVGFHWDKVHPDSLENCIEHLRRDSPFLYVAGCTLTGAGLGALMSAPSKKRDVIIKSVLVLGTVMFFLGVFTAEWD